VEKTIARKEGIPMKNAGAILANSNRHASMKAKAKNPRLNKTRGMKKVGS
jgi:hypothetical protein